MTTPATTYAIRVEGHLDDHWAAWLDARDLTRAADGTTILTLSVADQAQLHGVLASLRDIGAVLTELRARPSRNHAEALEPPSPGRPTLSPGPVDGERLRMDEERMATPSTRVASGGEAAVIVVGYDGSQEAAVAMRWAASWAQRTGSRLRMVWTWKLRDVWDAAVAADDEGTGPHLAELEAVARCRLTDDVARLLGPDASAVDIYLGQGPDAAGTLLHAARDADLLVVGSRGRGRATSAVLGSITARCVRESPVPVLVIPHRMVGQSDDLDAAVASDEGHDRLHPV